MNTREIIIKLAIKVGKVSFLKKLFRKPYDAYKARPHKQLQANFKKHGYEALVLFDKCLSNHGINYSLAFGTLLGAVREHDFIPYDDDIDVAMWIDDYRPEMIQYLREVGIKLKYSFSIEDDKLGKEDTFCYKGVLIDIFYFYHGIDNNVYCCDFVNQPNCHSRSESIKRHGGLLPRKLYMPLGKDVKRVMFKGINVLIPTNYHEILSFRYGNDYMTPKPGWRPSTKYIVKMPKWLGEYKEY